VLDGDALRGGLMPTSAARQQRAEAVRRIAEIATHLSRADSSSVVVAAVSPSRSPAAPRPANRRQGFYEIHVDAGEAMAAYKRPLAPDQARCQTASISTPIRSRSSSLLETAGVIASGERPDGGEYAI